MIDKLCKLNISYIMTTDNNNMNHQGVLNWIPQVRYTDELVEKTHKIKPKLATSLT